MRMAAFLTELMDNKFSFLGIRFGLDPLLDLFPVAGDIFATALSFYLVWIAYQINIPEARIHEMIGNIIFDFIIGLIPVIGEIGDMFYKSNTKNLKILRAYYKPVSEAEIISGGRLTPAIYR